jgi:ArsR family transcriptional regulator, virulence genes transcriptional regulator
MPHPRAPKGGRSARPPPGPADYRRVAQRLKGVADPVRLSVLLHLLEGERSVGELHDGLAVSLSAVSRQLAFLRLSGVVDTRRDGQRTFYRLTDAGRGLMLTVATLDGRDGAEGATGPGGR